ncbi:ATP-binding protein [Nocardioides cynanchi]|uniref:ATP-binding protein n=1 Tax=Nocardioides cynanchi TaxID=2558918 RepID=UPI003B51DEFD
MPLNRPAEPLPPGPRGAVQARRWVVGVCAEIDRPDLRDNAELALSEVVTNAILHGRPPMTVRLRGTVDHPRVEVRDQSTEPPALPEVEPDPESADLTTYGRGLSIVARASEAWGAEREVDGKLVWFVPATSFREEGIPGVLNGWDDEEDDPASDIERMSVRLDRVPVRLMLNALIRGAELRRELRLLAVAHEDTYPVAGDLSRFFNSVAGDFRGEFDVSDLHQCLATGHDHVDLRVSTPTDSGPRFARLIELLDLADAFCRNERLLTLARTDEQIRFQAWLFGEFVRQTRGDPPLRWSHETADLSRTHP